VPALETLSACLGTVNVKRDILIWVAILAIACGSCGRVDKAREYRQSKAQAAEREWQTNATAFAKKYNAIVDWKSALPNRGPFAADLSKALTRSNSPPLLLIVDLRDVAEKDGSYTAQFSENDFPSSDNDSPFSLELDCTQAQAEHLMELEKGGPFRYAVIAQVREVSRKASNDSVTGFVARGTCVDFMRGGKCESILGVLDE
jgi:hypothetical protein